MSSGPLGGVAGCGGYGCNLDPNTVVDFDILAPQDRTYKVNDDLLESGLIGPNHELYLRMDDPVALEGRISHGARVVNDNAFTLPILISAARRAPNRSIRLLLEAGGSAFVDESDDCGVPPILYAAERGDIDIVKTFLDCGADINACGSRDCETVLTRIVERADPKFIRALVKLGADPTLKGSANMSAVQLAERRFNKNQNEENRLLLEFLRSVRPRPR